MKKTIMALMATTFLMTAGAASAAINPVNIGESSSAENIYSVILDKVEAGETAGIQSGFAWAYVNGGFVSLSVTELQRHGANAGKFFSEYVGEQVLIDFIAKNEEKAAAMKEALFVLVDDGSRAALTFVQSQIASVEANIDAAQARLDGIESAIEAADMAAADARMEMLTAAESYMTELQTAYNEGETAGRMSVTPEDGIHQADVDSAYQTAFDAAAALVTPDDGVSEADHIRAIGMANEAAEAAGRLAGIAGALDAAVDAFDLSTLAANNPLLSVVGDRTAGFSLELDLAGFVNVDTADYKISIEAMEDRVMTSAADYSGLTPGFYHARISSGMTSHGVDLTGYYITFGVESVNGAITVTAGFPGTTQTGPQLADVTYAESQDVTVRAQLIQNAGHGTFSPAQFDMQVTGYTLSFDGVDASVAPTGDNALTFVEGVDARPLQNNDYFIQSGTTYVYLNGGWTTGPVPANGHFIGYAPTGDGQVMNTLGTNSSDFIADLNTNGIPTTEDRFVAADGFVIPAGSVDVAAEGGERTVTTGYAYSDGDVYHYRNNRGEIVHEVILSDGSTLRAGTEADLRQQVASSAWTGVTNDVTQTASRWVGAGDVTPATAEARYNYRSQSTMTVTSGATLGEHTFSVALSAADVAGINKAITDAYKAGYSVGYADGYEDGYIVGFQDGVASVTR